MSELAPGMKSMTQLSSYNSTPFTASWESAPEGKSMGVTFL